MADERPLLFRKVLGSLRPVNKAAEEAIVAIGDAPMRVRITRTTGNTRRNALYWSCLSIAAPMLSERIEGGALSVDILHRVLKRKGGLARPIQLPSGEVEWDTDSTSFAKMPENERARYIDWALQTLSKWLGVDIADLRREGEAEGC